MLKVRFLVLCLPLVLLGAQATADPISKEAGQQRGDLVKDKQWITVNADLLRAVKSELTPEVQAGLEILSTSASDRIAVIQASNEVIEKFSHALHEKLHRCGGFITHPSSSHALATAQRDGRARTRRTAYAAADLSLTSPDQVAAVQAQLAEQPMVDTILALSAYENRYYQSQTGLAAAEWIADQWRTIAAGRPDASVELIAHNWLQPSVSLTIRGAVYPDEIVVIGGHLDSIEQGQEGAMRAPGADDNASGIAVITEVARAIVAADFRPDRTLKIYGYSAEEVGLRGSQEIAAKAEADGLNIVGVLQLDMVNHKGSASDITIIQDYTDSGLNTFLEQLIDSYVGVTWIRDECGYACSDHASWQQAGFPAANPFEARSNDINATLHTPQDTIAVSDNGVEHAMKFAKLATAFVVELSKGQIGEDAECDDEKPCADGYTCSSEGLCQNDGSDGNPDDDDDPGDGDPNDNATTGPVIGSCGIGGNGTQGVFMGMLLLLAVGLTRRSSRSRNAVS